MSFTKYYKISSYCLITAGFVAIAATGSLDALSLLMFGVALVLSWFVDTHRVRNIIPFWLLNFVALAYLPIYLLDYFAFSRSFVVTTVHLILFVAAVKLLTRSNDRDYVYLYLTSSAELVAASTLTVDITFAVSLFVFLISSVCTLILYEIKRSTIRAQSQGKLEPLVVSEAARGTGLELLTPFPAGSMSWMSLGMTVTTLLLAVPIFFLIPRITLGFGNRPSRHTQLVSGFSEKVELGQIGNIKESDTVVMRVRVNSPPTEIPPNLKWRGVALDYYDGRSWSRSRLAQTPVWPDRWWYNLEKSVLENAPKLTQKFSLEALSTHVVFVAHSALGISRDLSLLRRDSDDNLFTSPHPYNKISYEAISDVSLPDPARLPKVLPSFPADFGATYLQLPNLDPRIAVLARTITGRIAHPYEKARVLESYLKGNYGYSLELKGSPNSKDPLAMFLFDVRRGHCEYFASAMTVMMRQVGIPARLVNGFRTGEFNNFGNVWIVRQYDAHSWVEAYYPPYGWVEFDPTPPDPQHSRPSLLRVISHIVDALDLWWTEEVVNYTFWKQSRLVSGLRYKVSDLQARFNLLLRSIVDRSRSQMDEIDLRRWLATHGLFLGTVIALSAPVFFLLRRYGPGWAIRLRRLLGRAMLRSDMGRFMASFYAEALDLLSLHGMSRHPGQTPLEFARTLEGHPAFGPFTALTEIYNRVRFGLQRSAEDISRGDVLLRTLRNALRAKVRSPLKAEKDSF